MSIDKNEFILKQNKIRNFCIIAHIDHGKSTLADRIQTYKQLLTYEFNLIDTPGHVDFTYEVSRSLAACEGAILVVDATQGVEAQTIANVYLALDNNLEILPLINKIDLPSADIEKAKHEIEDVIGLPASNAVSCSAKTGIGVRDILEEIVKYVPAPKGDIFAPTKALIFDSAFDPYRGVVVLICVKEGMIKTGDVIYFMATGAS